MYWNLRRCHCADSGRLIHHLGQIPGEVVNNSAFLVATHWLAVLYGEIVVVNNSPRSLPAKTECCQRNLTQRHGDTGKQIVGESSACSAPLCLSVSELTWLGSTALGIAGFQFPKNVREFSPPGC